MAGVDGRPLFIVRGDASAEEVAALVAVLLRAAGTARAAAVGVPPEWSAPRRRLRVPPSPGPGAWRASSLP
jgi:hypothetical protein